MLSLFNLLILMCLGDIQAKISDRLKSFQERFLVKEKGVAKFLLFSTPLNSTKNKQTKKSKNSLQWNMEKDTTTGHKLGNIFAKYLKSRL